MEEASYYRYTFIVGLHNLTDRLLRFLFCVHNRWAEFDQILYWRSSIVRRTCHTVFIKQHGRVALTD